MSLSRRIHFSLCSCDAVGRRILLLSALLLAMALPSFTLAGDWQQLTGKASFVADGDTFFLTVPASSSVKAKPQRYKIRLTNIDAPERHQPYGASSQRLLKRLLDKQPVTVRYRARDKYGRVLGDVSVNGEDINAAMLKAGLAWVYTHFNQRKDYPALEEAARAERKGLWKAAHPVAPWQWRKTHPYKPTKSKTEP